MNLKTGVGRSESADPFQAGADASREALKFIDNNDNCLLIIFASSKLDQKAVLAGANSSAKNIKIVGCSTAGEITDQGVMLNSVTAMALSSRDINFFIGRSNHMDKDAKKSGQTFAQNLLNQANNFQAVIMFPDGLAGNGAETIRGAQEVLKNKTLLLGGSAGDDFESHQTFEYFGNELLTKSIVGFGLTGAVKIGVGVCHGWTPVGVSRVVTKASGNIIYEMNNLPALDLYHEYMGEMMANKLSDNPMIAIHEGATHPLGIEISPDNYLIRQPFYAGKDGSLTCAAEVPIGSRVFLMIGDEDSVLASANDAAKNALDQLGGEKPSAVLIFSCGARSIILGHKKSDEIQTIRNIFGDDVPMAGFVCYGEQAPTEENIKNKILESYFHNETVVIIALK